MSVKHRNVVAVDSPRDRSCGQVWERNICLRSGRISEPVSPGVLPNYY